MDDTPAQVPTFKLGTRTLIFNAASEEPVAWVEGLLTLPVGAIIRLTDLGAGHGTFDGEVVQVGTLPVSAASPDVPMDLMLRVIPWQAGAADSGS
ncbi:hypothetical protein GALL_233170 [mine drainage metagenome]|uniref:Uncharacterized protein n=1 Tax=mine drainage metagenome TaxID=410659 RepID=A0A1J5RYS7_9ZZZZ